MPWGSTSVDTWVLCLGSLTHSHLPFQLFIFMCLMFFWLYENLHVAYWIDQLYVTDLSPLSGITAFLWWRGLYNSMKLWTKPCKATKDRWMIAESSDKMWYAGGENGKSPQYTCCENHMNCIKGQKDMTPNDESPRFEGVQHATGEEQRRITTSPRMNEAAGPKQIWCSVVDVSGG